MNALPRLVIAGLSGESGKTLISLALLLEARRRGVAVRAFKKGPDYIDAAWLSWAAGCAARNLDTFMMGFDIAAESFARNALHDSWNLVEGNRGLYDGVDARGSHSTAALAKAISAPVVLVLDATKMTRTAAALVLGCQTLDPEVRIAGVILNRVAGKRHEGILREAIETSCQVPVLGVIPKGGEMMLPTRHLGLVTPAEHPDSPALAQNLLALTSGHLDWDRLFEISQSAPRLAPARFEKLVTEPRQSRNDEPVIKIGYVKDAAFTFYYPENLDALRAAGAELVPVSALAANALPDDIDGLYIGGGFPETHARELAANTSVLKSIRQAAREGMAIYAECGGLMLLARSLVWEGRRYGMAGVLPIDVEVCPSPQGHGYVELSVDTANPFFPRGFQMKGHEFHYSRIVSEERSSPPTVCAMLRGTGCFERRDGIVIDNVWASYTHLHALATPEWARSFLAVVRRFARVAA